jgi:sugar (pentulose or hexulose) kinase
MQRRSVLQGQNLLHACKLARQCCHLCPALCPSVRAAAHLGLPVGLPVAQGGADAFIGCIGLGVIAPGAMAMLTGSSHLHIGMVDAPLSGRGVFGSYNGAVLPGVHVIEGGQVRPGGRWAAGTDSKLAPTCVHLELTGRHQPACAGCVGKGKGPCARCTSVRCGRGRPSPTDLHRQHRQLAQARAAGCRGGLR